MSKMSQISAEMDEANVSNENRNSLISRVSEGMHAAEKKIDSRPKTQPKKMGDVSPKNTKPNLGLTYPNSIDKDTLETASQIRDFADRTHNVVTLDGKSYVKVGVYQYIAKLMSIVPVFDFSPESTQTEVWCTCSLVKSSNGDVFTRATMYADKDEEFLKDKPDYAVLGMAQTRAFGRAMKNVFGYLVELAGYQSVPIEEINKGDK